MKKITTLLLLATLCLAAQAQLLWRVSGPGTQGDSYLFGTCHVIDGTFIDQVPGLPQAIAACDMIALEVSSDSLQSPASMQKVLAMMTAHPDSTLDKVMTPAQTDTLTQMVASMLGGGPAASLAPMLMQQFNGMKPAAVSQQLSLLMLRNTAQKLDLTNLIDAAVEHRVSTQGKPVHSLETVDFQMNLLLGKPIASQVDDLMSLCRDPEKSSKLIMDLVSNYTQQNLEQVGQLMLEESGVDQQQMQELIYDRNHNWVAQLQPLMSKGRLLVSVGAGHLPGDQGLIALLRNAGYTIEPVTAQ